MKGNDEMKTKTIKMIGYRIEGYVNFNFWGGGEGEGKMQSFDILHPEMTLEEVYEVLNQGINDNGFGVESFNSAYGSIYELYENNVTEFVDDFEIEPTKEKPFKCGFFDENINGRMVRNI